MSRVIVVTSGKGGVGKTTTSANVAMGLALQGHKTVVIDFDVGLRNLDLILGCERRVVYDFVNVINGDASLKQALIQDKRSPNLFILAASQTQDKESLTHKGVEKVINGLKKQGFKYIICDSPAGIETGAMMAMYWADEAIVVTNPEVSSVRDSDRIVGMLNSKTLKSEDNSNLSGVKCGLLITRYDPVRVKNGEMLAHGDLEEMLGIELIGVVPDSPDVMSASNSAEPVILLEESVVSVAYKDLVSRIEGKEVDMKFLTVEKKGFLKNWFGG